MLQPVVVWCGLEFFEQRRCFMTISFRVTWIRVLIVALLTTVVNLAAQQVLRLDDLVSTNITAGTIATGTISSQYMIDSNNVAFGVDPTSTSTLTTVNATTTGTSGNSTVGGTLTVGGAIGSSSNITAAGFLQNVGFMYPGRVDTTAAQGTWYLASHASYGLYSNTGLLLTAALHTPSTIYSGAGAANAPISYRGADPDTGMWFPTTDQVGFTAGGTNQISVHSGGLAVVNNVQQYGVVTHTGTTGNNNNVNIGNAYTLRVNTNAGGVVLTGMTGGVQGRTVQICSVGFGATLSIASGSASTFGNNFTAPALVTQSVEGGACSTAVYDGTDSVWRIVGAHQ